ncbi:glycine/sarcosine/betaine reductase component B subunit, partial [Parvimonas sp. M20]|uniref:glycine/sarcosine/betaine reductase component B subunit n=1 Tax=Parvimonas sp. M20 TaxID=3110693 RepID=UPI002B477AC5
LKNNHAIRWATHKFEEYLGKTVKELNPEETDVFEFDPVLNISEKINSLPKVVLVIQPQSQMEEMGYNDLIY